MKGLPLSEHPQSLEDMYDAIRRWAEKERATRGEGEEPSAHPGRRRRERGWQTQEKAADDSAELHAGNASAEYAVNLLATGVSQALAKAG